MPAQPITSPPSVPPHDGLCDEQGPIPVFPPAALDSDGRLLPISEEERKARADAAIRALKALSQISDETDTDEGWAEVYRDLDAQRPHRPLFEGQY